MNKLIPLSLAVLGLSLLPLEVSAKHEREHERYEHRHEHKKHSKKHHKKYYKHRRKHHDTVYYRELPPGLYKKVARGRGLPPGWYKKYHRGDRLDRDIYRRGRVIKRHDRQGLILLEVDDRLIHLVHDTREILSIVSRHH